MPPDRRVKEESGAWLAGLNFHFAISSSIKMGDNSSFVVQSINRPPHKIPPAFPMIAPLSLEWIEEMD